MLFWQKARKELLDPAFVSDLEALFSNSPHDWYVTFGWRSRALQTTLYEKHLAGGPLAAPPGNSAHEFGLAVDVAPDLDGNRANGLQPNWVTSTAPWAWLKAKTVPHPRLRSGWSFNDAGHIERFRWRNHTKAAT